MDARAFARENLDGTNKRLWEYDEKRTRLGAFLVLGNSRAQGGVFNISNGNFMDEELNLWLELIRYMGRTCRKANSFQYVGKND